MFLLFCLNMRNECTPLNESLEHMKVDRKIHRLFGAVFVGKSLCFDFDDTQFITVGIGTYLALPLSLCACVCFIE